MWFPLEIKIQRHGFLAPFHLHSQGGIEVFEMEMFHRKKHEF